MNDRSLLPGEQEPTYSKSDPSDSLYKQLKFDDATTTITNQLGFNGQPKEKAQNIPIKTEFSSAVSSNLSTDSNSRTNFSSQASEYRKAFYHFQRMLQTSEHNALQYNTEFQKNLNIKTQNILDLKGMADYFERQLFKLARNPKQVRKNWSEDETLLLLSMMAYFCSIYNEDFMNLNDKVWDHLATMYPGKSAEQLRLRWHNILKVPLNKTPWTRREDEMLEELVSERGANHWREIAMELHSRTGSVQFRQSKQCRERWTNHLDPSLKKGSWSNKEDVTLLKEFLQKGKRWSEIAKMLPGRTENSVKNRWVSLLKKYKSEMTLEAIRLSEEYKDDDMLNEHIAKALIELKEKDLSATSSEDEQSLFSVELPRILSSGSGSGDNKSLASNLKNQEYMKQNKFISDKIQDSFNKQREVTTDPFLSKNTNYVPHDSFKELIEWQNDQDKPQQPQIKTQPQQQQTFQQPTQQVNQQSNQQSQPFQTFPQQQQVQQMPQQSQQQTFQQPTQQVNQQSQQQQQPNQFYAGGQNNSSFSQGPGPQNMVSSGSDPNQQYQNKDSMFFNQGQNQGSFNMSTYPMPMMPYPMQYNYPPQNYPYYPNTYGNAPQYYQQGPYPNNPWGGMPNYNPNYMMNQSQFQQYPPQQQQYPNQQQYQPQQQQLSNPQQYSGQQQPQLFQQQPQYQQQMQPGSQNQYQGQMQPQPQLFQQNNPTSQQTNQTSQQNQGSTTDPRSNHQFREMPISSLLENNTTTQNSNSNPNNYYLAMVDVNKNEIFFMNQVNQDNLEKTVGTVNTQNNQQMNQGGSIDGMFARFDDTPNKYGGLFDP